MRSLAHATRSQARIARLRSAVAASAKRPADALQRSLGNTAVQHLYESGLLTPAARETHSGLEGASAVQSVLQGPGQPLEPVTRAEMEARFGRDFGEVRIHVGWDAAASASAVNAKAYTFGRHIVFGTGQYAPDSVSGRHLLAHELAHVVQQSRGGGTAAGTDSQLEAGAEQAAAAVARGHGAVSVSGASGAGIARQESSFEERVRRELHDEMLKQLFGAPSTPPGSEPAQANQPLLSILNGAFFGGNNPVGTLSTDIFGIPLAFQSPTDPQTSASYLPSFTLQVRDRLSPTSELGVFGSVGGAVPLGIRRNPMTGLLPPPGAGPSSVTTGALGFTYHSGPEAPSDESRYTFGKGYWFTLGQYWGLEPPRSPVAPPGWSFNPTANLMYALSWARAKHGEADLILGASLGRWGQVNGVPVGGIFAPYAGFSYSWNINDDDTIFAEIAAGPNLGLAGRFDAGSGFPASLLISGGIGYQHTSGDWGFGIEPWIFSEPFSSVSAPAAGGFSAGASGNIGGGLRFNLTGINPRRRRFLDEP
ncbi:protein of unknown function [Rhizobiales bacterium GAS188]|nr:protein of unknown function [Rhizobiales bacterium GAS188]